MTKLLAVSVLLVLAAESAALVAPDRRVVYWLSGVAVAVAVMAFCWALLHRRVHQTEPPRNDAAESLGRWLARTQTLIGWADTTRADWDRHLRPMLARQFSLATGQRQAKDPAAFRATGEVLFGPDLWQWVDPNNVARAGRDKPGPGRGTLDEIMRRLEQV